MCGLRIWTMRQRIADVTGLKGRIKRGLAWRWSEIRRNGADLTGALQYWLARRSGAVKHTQGTQHPAERIAIYVMYPQQGLRTSHLHALRAILDCGYVTLVVSNLPLTELEREKLAPLVWKMLERPNFGYDFGAYREGIQTVAPMLAGLQRLVLMNDSVWFPLPGGADWPLKAEAIGTDVVGAVSNCGVAMPEPSALDGFRRVYDPGLPEFHYCSFAFSFGPQALSDPAFQRFWARIRLTNNKFHTVLRGEVALSRALISARLSHSETLDIKDLGARLGVLREVDLKRFVEELAIPEDTKLEAMRQRILAEPDGPGRHQQLLSAALGIVALTGPAYAMPAFAYDALRHPFLKKSPLRLSRPAAEASLRLSARLPGSYGAAIHSEAREIAVARFGETIGLD